MKVLEKLTDKEEEVMRAIWSIGKGFVKEIKAQLSSSLHYNTVSTIVRHLEDKKYVAHHSYGNTHQYYPIVKQEEYQREVMENTTNKFFEGSYKNLVSFFAKEEKISSEDLEEILKIIKNK